VAHSAADALEMMDTRTFDVVLTDVRMPGLDGPKFFEHLKRFHPQMRCRVIFITGDTLTPRVRRFLERSGQPYLDKPVRPAEIRQLLASVGRAVPEPERGECT
jgi:CheY-like chemotaxis protein